MTHQEEIIEKVLKKDRRRLLDFVELCERFKFPVDYIGVSNGAFNIHFKAAVPDIDLERILE